MRCDSKWEAARPVKMWTRLIVITSMILVLHRSQAAEITYSIQEEIPVDTFVGNVADDYDLRSTMTSEEYNNLVYKILGAGNIYAPFFRVVNTTGQLYTTDLIDRDSICVAQPKCIISLEIAVKATVGAFFRKITVDIEIRDLNDNSPVFPSNVGSTEFSENSISGTTRTIPGAKDRDTGNNTVVNYYIETKDVPFTVTMEKKPDGSSVVKIVVNGDLDREVQDLYQLKVVAEDGGFPKRTGTIDVAVTILDVNDNTPTFDREFYNVTLKEDFPINAVFETITATDKDIGRNGEIRYSLSANQNEDILKLFAINESSGELSTVGQLIYSPDEPLVIFVEATDMGSQPRTSQIAVYINIQDFSNNPPEINVNILSGDTDARVSEYANVGAVVAHIAVVDVDTGRNGKVECVGISSNFQLERYESNEYKAVVYKELDRERVDTHEVTIVCKDSGTPPLNTTAKFTVRVMDENDNKPRFTQNTYYAKTEENNAIGDIIARVTAEDLDTGINAKITYSLLDTNGYDFWIDSETGEIRANFRLDRENVSQISLRVKAADGGQPQMTTISNVILTVTDQNDNFPIFSQPNYAFFVYEGVPNNTTVDQLTAIDKDYGINGTISFSFKTLPSSNFPFILNSNGTIKMIRRLDREFKSMYEFVVIASDMGSNPLSSSVTVTVSVLDVNDNAPEFVFPVDDNNTATIPLSAKLDSVTIVVTAIDRDEGVNSELSFSILDNNTTGLFSIENLGGVGHIKILRFPGSSDALRYTLRLKAEDHGTPRQSVIKPLTIAFIKDTPPEENKNFLIAVALGCVTVVLSIAIVLTICLIRRHDRLNNKNCKSYGDKADVEIVPADSKPHAEFGSTSSGSKESLKKVSFSTDFNSTMESDNLRDLPQAMMMNLDHGKPTDPGRHQSSSSTPRSFTSSPHPQDGGDPQKLDPSTVLQLHRSLLQSHDQLWTNHRDGHTPPLTKELLNHHEDNGSESSGETATYDSGRGGSESDIQTSYSQSHDSDHIKTVTFANKPRLHHFPSETQWRDPKDFSVNYLYHHNHDTGDSSVSTKPVLPKRDYSKEATSHGHKHKHYNVSPGYDATQMTSYDEDDETTTSGSYTIDTEDWMNDPHSQPRPYGLNHKEAYC